MDTRRGRLSLDRLTSRVLAKHIGLALQLSLYDYDPRGLSEYAGDDYQQRRPRTRGDCSQARAGVPGCPYVTCRHHLWTGNRAEEFAELIELDPDEWPETCSLDVADEMRHDKLSHAVIGPLMGFSRENSRLAQLSGLEKLRDDQ